MRRLSPLPLAIVFPAVFSILMIATFFIAENTIDLFSPNLPEATHMAVEFAIIGVLGMVSGLLISRRIGKPLIHIAEALRRVGERNFSVEIPAFGHSTEIGRVVDALIGCRDQLAKSESTLQQQSQLLKAISAAQGMIEFDASGNILATNQVFLDSVGYSEAEVIGRHHSLFVGREFAQSNMYHKMWEALARGEALTGTFKREARDGKAIYLQGTYSPVFDANSKVTRVVKVASDVTEVEAKRLALDAYMRDQAALIEAISGGLQGMIEFDHKGIILAANRNYLDITGYTEAEIVGRHHSIFIDDEAAESDTYQREWEALAGGQPIRGTFKRLAKDGRAVYLQGSYSPVRNAAGEVVRVVKIASDVTKSEIKRLEMEEEAIEQAALISAMSDKQALVEFDTKGVIQKANQNFLTLMGYTEQEVIGRPHTTFAKASLVQSKEYQDMWRALSEGASLAGTFERVTKDGRTVWVQGSCCPVRDRNGAVKRIVMMAWDISMVESERLEGIATRQAMEADLSQVVDSLNGGLAKLARGDLSTRIENSFANDFEGLRKNFNTAIEQLEHTISSVVVNADNIRGEAHQVAAAADELAQRTESQAATLEETAAAIQELTSSVKATAKTAEMASEDVANTRKAAIESGRVVKKAVKAMSKIEKSSKQISQIIGVIEDIAFQTNLLALNAGVEAARAGDAGRGFAVVASEVQALATRSSDAAKEIKELISTSSQQVGNGVELVGKAGRALTTIVDSVSDITTLMNGIARSAGEQSIGIGEINTAVNQLDQVTQKNAAMVEDATAASHAMHSEAAALSDIVAQFQTTGSTKTRTAPASRKGTAEQHTNVAPLPLRAQITPSIKQAESRP